MELWLALQISPGCWSVPIFDENAKLRSEKYDPLDVSVEGRELYLVVL